MSTEKTAAHTPGPWYAEQDGNSDNWSVASEDWGGIVTRICYPDPKVDTSAEADARLIAAAPDLLAALSDCLESLSRMPGSPGAYRITCMTQARTAIAKAAGD